MTGSLIQFGDDDTAPARSNYGVTSPLGTSPESAVFATAPGIYGTGLGQVSLSGAIVAGGSGTIKESCLLWALFSYGGSAVFNFAIFHDLISPTLPFVAGDTLVYVYGITF